MDGSKTLELIAKEAEKIAVIGIRWGRLVESAREYPMNSGELKTLLEEMKPYKNIFEKYVEAAKVELNALHPRPASSQNYGKPRFTFEIPE